MALKPSRFKLDEEISLGGKPMRVAGLLQFEDGSEGKAATRYLLAGSAGVPQILEESGGSLLLLRPFPPAAQIEPSGDTVTVMGTPYKLATLRKLKVLGSAGEAPGGAPAGPLVLSGIFQGGTGALLREIVPGKPGHTFYAVKQLPASDVLSAAQLAEQQEAERLAAAQRAEQEEDDEDEGSGKGGLLKQAANWGVTILIVVGLAFACTGDDDEGSGSARTSIHHSSGGK